MKNEKDFNYRCPCCSGEIKTSKGLFLPYCSEDDSLMKVCKGCSDKMYILEIVYISDFNEELEGAR